MCSHPTTQLMTLPMEEAKRVMRAHQVIKLLTRSSLVESSLMSLNNAGSTSPITIASHQLVSLNQQREKLMLIPWQRPWLISITEVSRRSCNKTVRSEMQGQRSLQMRRRESSQLLRPPPKRRDQPMQRMLRKKWRRRRKKITNLRVPHPKPSSTYSALRTSERPLKSKSRVPSSSAQSSSPGWTKTLKSSPSPPPNGTKS